MFLSRLLHSPPSLRHPHGAHGARRRNARRATAAVATAVIAATALAGCSSATDSYPSKKFEFLVAYGAGSANDTIARSFGAALEQVTGENVLVVNQPGANGIVGTTQAMLAPADGYNMLLAPIASFTTAPLLQEVHYSNDDFRTVAALAEQPFAITVPADSPYHSLRDLATAPDGFTAASLGTGHAGEIVIMEIMDALGKDVQPVPFDGSGAAVQSTIAGETDVAVIDVNTAVSRVNSGEVRVIGVTGDKRVTPLPDSETVMEAGFPLANYMAAQAVTIPADTPDEIADRLEELAKQAMESDSYQEFLTATNIQLPDMDPEEWLTSYATEEKERLTVAYEKFGIAQ